MEEKSMAEKLQEVFIDCLYRKEEIIEGQVPADCVKVEGIVNNFGFHPQRLESHRKDVIKFINELNSTFFEGWSFLNLAFDKYNRHWGEHRNCEQLVCLAIGLKLADFLFSRDMWEVLPGGMPYVIFSKTEILK